MVRVTYEHSRTQQCYLGKESESGTLISLEYTVGQRMPTRSSSAEICLQRVAVVTSEDVIRLRSDYSRTE